MSPISLLSLLVRPHARGLRTVVASTIRQVNATRALGSVIPRKLEAPSALFGSTIRRLSTAAPEFFQVESLPDSSTTVTLDNKIRVNWHDGQQSQYHNVWLRDHCRCPECYHQLTRQRLVNTFKIPTDIRPSDLTLKKDTIEVTWANDSHKSIYPLTWLRQHSYDPPLADPKTTEIPIFWGAEIAENPPTVQFDDVMHSDSALSHWLTNITTYGFSFVDGVPVTPSHTEQLARRICFLRETHYARGLWDFTADLAHGDTAYTDLALRAHTDNTYFTDPSGLQLFHLLEFDGTGGQSLLVDGFHAAAELHRRSPDAYATLAEIPVPTHSAGDAGVFIIPTPRARPILNHDPVTGRLYQVRYNNGDRSTLTGLEARDVERFYEALRRWDEVIEDKAMEFWTALRPGRAMIFDNWRCLHGRAAFTGHRRLCGVYLNWDDYRSRVRVLGLSEEKERLI
ncbi:trimethyllysine dioxygenase [Jimgerdemannia flammicorona]|uniref:trimethyllysine dioxygenase n=2 Tax=Jimgerdemannia flammicorona TaxID=994334 RepID=A0A433DMS0_9FUNG|nr:trimethyllysine dioxygenase [Jimgerdemannia flammicorona]RUS24909.1 trimethyllysine dioxygenase [Jimgerdemannia flammicorona]